MDWGYNPQAGRPSSGQASTDMSQYVTRDEMMEYIRGNEFRSIMMNQNSDLYEFGKWTSFEPKLKASVTDPSMGTSGVATGRYTRIGNTVIYTFGFKFSSGADSGSGNWYTIAPVEAAKPSIKSRGTLNPYTNDIYLQSFQGTFYLQQWSSSDASNPGRLAWGNCGIETDYNTGEVLKPTRISFHLGYLGYLGTSGGAYNPSNGEPIIDQLTFKYARRVTNDWPWAGSTPTTSSILTGQIIYEAEDKSVTGQLAS